MPIKVKQNLPARDILENENIFVEKWDNKGEISWLHIDISPNTHGKKLYFFKA